MRDETEYLHVGLVRLGELLDTIGLLDGLAEAFGDSQVNSHLVRAEGVRLLGAAEKQADGSPLDLQRAGHAASHALFQQDFC